jgi:transcriptional regulator with XRE-family HTH domain
VWRQVKAQIRWERERKHLSLQDLSERLTKVGRPILPSGISKIEQGDRRVDVDDLVALADALGTVPGAILQGPLRESVALTEEQEEIGKAAIDAVRQCEAAGMSRYDVIAWMNMADGARRLMERDPTGRELALALTETATAADSLIVSVEITAAGTASGADAEGRRGSDREADPQRQGALGCPLFRP